MIRYPFNVMFNIINVIKKTVFNGLPNKGEVIPSLCSLRRLLVRKVSLLWSVQFEDPFLAKGIQFCVDGAEGHQIEGILTKEIQYIKARHQAGNDMR